MAAIKPTVRQRARALLLADVSGMRVECVHDYVHASAAPDQFDGRVAGCLRANRLHGGRGRFTRNRLCEHNARAPRTSTACQHAPQSSLVLEVSNAHACNFIATTLSQIRQFTHATCVFALCKFCETGTLEAQALAHQNVLRYMDETILQRDNPVRKCPNWRNCFEASNVSSRTSVMHKKRHARAAQFNRLRGENTASGRVSWNRQTKIDR
jgi:hypothetical protein